MGQVIRMLNSTPRFLFCFVLINTLSERVYSIKSSQDQTNHLKNTWLIPEPYLSYLSRVWKTWRSFSTSIDQSDGGRKWWPLRTIPALSLCHLTRAHPNLTWSSKFGVHRQNLHQIWGSAQLSIFPFFFHVCFCGVVLYPRRWDWETKDIWFHIKWSGKGMPTKLRWRKPSSLF